MPLDNIAHVIQVALTPVFLLSGIGALLNVVRTRLAPLIPQTRARIISRFVRGWNRKPQAHRNKKMRTCQSLPARRFQIFSDIGDAEFCSHGTGARYGNQGR